MCSIRNAQGVPALATFAFLLLVVAAPEALAVTITKPLPNETVLEENVGEVAPITLAGHYARTTGGCQNATFVWTSIPQGRIKFNYAPDPKRHTVRIMAVPGVACMPEQLYLKVTDPGWVQPYCNGSTHIIPVEPIKFSWLDNSSNPSDNRLVGLTQPGSQTVRERTVTFIVTGKANVKKEVRIRTFDKIYGSGGRIKVVAYDGDPLKVQEVTPVTCNAAPNAPPTGEWVITVPVTASCSPGTEHTITIQGERVSLSPDDIEIDLIAYQVGATSCYDGIGCVMDYTVASVGLSATPLTEIEEETKGEYVYHTVQGGERSAGHYASAMPVYPVGLTGYKLRVETSDTRVYCEDPGTSTPFIFRDKTINADLPYLFGIIGMSQSATVRDTEVRVVLVSATSGLERGGGSCRDHLKVTSVGLDIVSPSAAPMDDVGDAAQNGNEFSFNATPDPSALLDVYCRLTAEPDDANVQSELKDKITFEFTVGTPMAGSTLAWSPGTATVGEAEYTAAGGLGARWKTRARFTRMPLLNNAFGVKTVRLKVKNPDNNLEFSSNQTRTLETFYPRNASNHPGGVAGTPNWFYYWGQVYPNANVVYNAGLAAGGRVPGMTGWSYTTAPNKTRIEIGTLNPGSYRSYGVGELLSGIDRFIGTVIHEEKHILQIAAADGLVPVAAGTCFRYGWSWNQGSYNHWDNGADGNWGVSGVDDDSNGTTDDAATSPPFEPGNGDDNDLSLVGDINWPAAWALPVPNNGPIPIESEAINWSDARINEHEYAAQDWAFPGKRHRTNDLFSD